MGSTPGELRGRGKKTISAAVSEDNFGVPLQHLPASFSFPADQAEISRRQLPAADLGSAWHFNSHLLVGVVGGT